MAAIVEHNKYNSSRIYKIQSSLTDKIYIGSTCQALSQRMAGHNRHYKQYLKTNTNYITSYEIINLGDAYITLIEECNYNNKQQLLMREGELIKDNINICVNMVIAGRTNNEWRYDNKEALIKYRQDNKESMKQYYNDNKEIILERHKKHYESNKQVINEKQKQLVYCECGNSFTVSNKSQHNKTKKHISFITNQYYINELTYYNL